MKIKKFLNSKEGIELSIIIVNFNSVEFITRCLNYILKNKPKTSFEIIVVDNDSKDNSVGIIRKDFPEVKLIENSSNFGFSYANNQGIVRSNGRYILILNPDTIVTAGAMDTLINFMRVHPDAGVAGAKMLNFDGSIQYSCRRYPTLLNVFFGRQSFFTKFFPYNRISKRYLMMDEDYSKNMEVDWVFGASMLIRRKAIEDVGIFDEDYFIFVEDTDLCYRMMEKGWKIYFVADAVIFHHLGVTRDRYWKITLPNHNIGMFKFFQKHYKPNPLIQFLLFAGLSLRLLVLVFIKTVNSFLGS